MSFLGLKYHLSKHYKEAAVCTKVVTGETNQSLFYAKGLYKIFPVSGTKRQSPYEPALLRSSPGRGGQKPV